MQTPHPVAGAGTRTLRHPTAPEGDATLSGPVARIIAARQPVDRALFEQIVMDESRRLDLPVTVDWTESSTTDDFRAAAGGAATIELLVVPGPGAPDLDLPPTGGTHITRVDLAVREPDRSPALDRHIAGRGIDGIRWAMRAIHHARRYPAHRRAYGRDPEQCGELRLPATPGPHPVAVLLHGGFWRSRWQLDLMDALANDLAQRSVASWNVEYRRPDRHGWDSTVADVADAIEHLHELAEDFNIDPERVALVGHSAGGQLAVQYAADRLATRGDSDLRLLVPLAGVLDVLETYRRDLGEGAVRGALGGPPEEIPDVYQRACPLRRLPVPVDQLVVIGVDDSPDLREMSRRYALQAGPRARLLEQGGDHFTVIDPTSRIWDQTASAICSALDAEGV